MLPWIKCRSIWVIFLVFGRLRSIVLSPRPSDEQSKGMCSKYNTTHGIRSKPREFWRFRIVVEPTL